MHTYHPQEFPRLHILDMALTHRPRSRSARQLDDANTLPGLRAVVLGHQSVIADRLEDVTMLQ